MDNEDQFVICGDECDPEISKINSLGAFILENLTEGGDKVSMINGKSEESITFLEVKRRSLELAVCLQNYGITENSAVAIVSENRFEFSIISCATLLLGAIVNPVSFMYTERELKHVLSLSNPTIVFTSQLGLQKIVDVSKIITSIKHIVLLDDEPLTGSNQMYFKDFVGKFKEAREFVPSPTNIEENIAVILYSSGTTGMQKGVQLTQTNLLYIYHNAMVARKLMGYQNLNLLGFPIAPWYHAFGYVGQFINIVNPNTKTIFIPVFDPMLFLSCIEKYKVTHCSVVPPILVFLAKSPIIDQYDLSSLMEIGSGGAPVSTELQHEIYKKFKNLTLRQGYGMTETTLAVTSQTKMVKHGSVGSLQNGIKAKVIDENGKSLGPNQRGELCFKGPILMKGYIGNDEATKQTIDENGWLHSGDIAYYDEDKQFFIVDRIKELIKYKGHQVAPAEIEAILLTHPKVNDAGVIGIPDEDAGELPMAFVVKKPDIELSEKDIIDFVAKVVSNPKRLRGGVKFINEIPKNPSGKILRRLLRQQITKTVSKL